MPRPRKPTALKIAEGNPGHQRLNHNEPTPQVGLPDAPEHLSPGARHAWREIGPALARNKVMTEMDTVALALLCETYSAWRVCVGKAQQHGPVVKQNGVLTANPYLSRADKEADRLMKMLSAFGMDPASRSRLRVEMGQGKTDELESFLKIAS